MSNLRNAYNRIANPERVFYSRRVTNDGQLENPGNVVNMVGDYSGLNGPVVFWCQPKPNQLLRVSSIQLLISDNGNPAQEDYGNITDGLSVGVRFLAEQNGIIAYSETILNNNVDVLGFSGSFQITQLANSIRVISYRRFFERESDDFRILDVAPVRFGVELHDDFSDLQRHMMWVSGSQQIARITGWLVAAIAAMLPFIQTGVTI